jgi:hypothetical protein
MEENSYLLYPTDKDGYSIDVKETELVDTMNKYGLVVINVLDEKACDKTVSAMWEEMNVKGKLDQKDSKTWETCNFPHPTSRFLSYNFALHLQAWENRVNPKVVNVFEILYGTKNIVTTVDYWGLKRGTHFEWGTRPEWRDPALRLHWDMNIYNYKRGLYQGLIALVDCDYQVGSFAAVPGCHKYFDEWRVKNTSINNLKVPENDEMQKHIQKIWLRKGCIVVWERSTAHCNFGNNLTDKCRLVQYMRMVPRVRHVEDKQSILLFWDENKEMKEKVRLMKHWTKKELKMLGLI